MISTWVNNSGSEKPYERDKETNPANPTATYTTY
jgi:hypothetical protein